MGNRSNAIVSVGVEYKKEWNQFTSHLMKSLNAILQSTGNVQDAFGDILGKYDSTEIDKIKADIKSIQDLIDGVDFDDFVSGGQFDKLVKRFNQLQDNISNLSRSFKDLKENLDVDTINKGVHKIESTMDELMNLKDELSDFQGVVDLSQRVDDLASSVEKSAKQSEKAAKNVAQLKETIANVNPDKIEKLEKNLSNIETIAKAANSGIKQLKSLIDSLDIKKLKEITEASGAAATEAAAPSTTKATKKKKVSSDELAAAFASVGNGATETKTETKSKATPKRKVSSKSSSKKVTESTSQTNGDENTIAVSPAVDPKFKEKAQTQIDAQAFENTIKVTPTIDAEAVKSVQEKLDETPLSAKIGELKTDEDVSVTKDTDRENESFSNLSGTIETVTSAVQNKTDAIVNEGVVAESVISSEISNFSDLAQSISSAMAMINNFRDSIFALGESSNEVIALVNALNSFDGTSFTAINESFDKLKTADDIINNSSDFSSEAQSLRDLQQAVEDVVISINKKNEAFESEGEIVRVMVATEANYLNELMERLAYVILRVQQLNQAFLDTGNSAPNLSGILKTPKNFSSEVYNELAKALTKLKNATKDFDADSFERFIIDVGALKVPASAVKNLSTFGDALKKLRKDFSEIEKSGSTASNSFIQDLNALLSRSNELKDLASILSNSTKKIKEVANATGTKNEIVAVTDSYEMQTKAVEENGEAIRENFNLIRSEQAAVGESIVDSVFGTDEAIDAKGAKFSEIINKIKKVSTTDKITINPKTGKGKVASSVKVTAANGNTYSSTSDGVSRRTQDIYNLTKATRDYSKALETLNKVQNSRGPEDMSTELKQRVDDLKEALSKVQEISNTDVFSTDDVQKQSVAFSDAATEAKKCADAIDGMTAAQMGIRDVDVQSTLSDINTWMANNTKAAKVFEEELTNLKNELKTLGADVDLSSIKSRFSKITSEAAEEGILGPSLTESIKKQFQSKTASLVTSYLSIQDMIRYTQQALSTINDLDYALLDLKKTTSMTDDELENFYYTASDLAGQVGVTTEEIIDLASAWSRLGYSSKEAAENMAQLTAEMAMISPGMTTDEAQEGMVSLMKAYGVEVEDVQRKIMDNINALGKMLPKRMVTYGALCA